MKQKLRNGKYNVRLRGFIRSNGNWLKNGYGLLWIVSKNGNKLLSMIQIELILDGYCK